MLTAIRSQRHRSFSGQWVNFQSKCAFEFACRCRGVEVADPNIWRRRSFSIHTWRRFGPIPFLSWLFIFLGLLHLGNISNLCLFHLLLRLLRQFLLTLLRFAHFDLLKLPLRLFRIFHLCGHGLFQGKLHLFAFIYKLRQFIFKFGGKFEPHYIRFWFAEEIAILAQSFQLDHEHLFVWNRLLVHLLVRDIIPNLISCCTFFFTECENGVGNHINMLMLHPTSLCFSFITFKI